MTRSARIVCLMASVLAGLAIFALVEPADAAARTPVINGDNNIAGFKTKRPQGGTLADARDAFGSPSSVRRRNIICTVKWRNLGLKLNFANLGGANPCSPETGFFTRAVTTNKNWRTSRGLRVGQRLKRLRRLYPRAEITDRQGRRNEWGLIMRPVPEVFGGGEIARLVAYVRKGRVTGFEVRQSNAGE